MHVAFPDFSPEVLGQVRALRLDLLGEDNVGNISFNGGWRDAP